MEHGFAGNQFVFVPEKQNKKKNTIFSILELNLENTTTHFFHFLGLFISNAFFVFFFITSSVFLLVFQLTHCL